VGLRRQPVDSGQEPDGLRLEQAERWGGDDTLNAVRVSLPPKPFL
jgi:hypothetical protein